MFRRGMGRVGRPGLVGLAARTAVVAGTATAVSGSVQRNQQAKAAEAADAQAYRDQQAAAQYAPPPQQADEPTPAPAAPGTDDLIEQLQKLAQLRDAGVLTEEEFSAGKARLLNA